MTLRNKDYYKILQVDPSAEQEVIEAAYKRLVRMYHPDINKSPDATIRMQEINAAYALLRSPAKRVQYDKERSFQSSWSDAKYAEECRRREEAEATRRRTEIEELLESSRDLIRQQLGQPDREGLHSDGFYFDCFYKAGVVVCYDKAGKAVKVEATQFVSGDIFRGKVLGISLADSENDCIRTWGSPVRTKRASFLGFELEYKTVTWHYKGYIIELEIWTENGNFSNKALGKYKKNTVRNITLSKKSE